MKKIWCEVVEGDQPLDTDADPPVIGHLSLRKGDVFRRDTWASFYAVVPGQPRPYTHPASGTIVEAVVRPRPTLEVGAGVRWNYGPGTEWSYGRVVRFWTDTGGREFVVVQPVDGNPPEVELLTHDPDPVPEDEFRKHEQDGARVRLTRVYSEVRATLSETIAAVNRVQNINFLRVPLREALDVLERSEGRYVEGTRP